MERQTTSQSTDYEVIDITKDISFLNSASIVKKATDGIKRATEDVANSFVKIGFELSTLNDNPTALSDCGYDSIYDYSSKVFGFKDTSTKNFIGVFKKYSDKGNSYFLDPKYRNYSFTQLVELLPVSDDMDSYKPEMTVKEIRDTKVLNALKDSESNLSSYVLREIKKSFSFADAELKNVRMDDSCLSCDVEGSYKENDFDLEIRFYRETMTFNPDYAFKFKGQYITYMSGEKTADKLAKKVKSEMERIIKEDKSKEDEPEEEAAPRKDYKDIWDALTDDQKASLFEKDAIYAYEYDYLTQEENPLAGITLDFSTDGFQSVSGDIDDAEILAVVRSTDDEGDSGEKVEILELMMAYRKGDKIEYTYTPKVMARVVDEFYAAQREKRNVNYAGI